MSKMAVLGHNRDDLVDCSEVIPKVREVKKKPFLPAGKTMDNIQASCPDTPFPTLTADPGPETAVHPEFLPGNETKATL
ncbi:fungal class II heme-containing peroxidase [Marasmius tenuissimus]|uniref:Fungal class II heme-containing peroxidase n=1 Tax=Marasmius tenuissimus TaxID=585030 RepID=A0ABR2ZSH1_9AGAR